MQETIEFITRLKWSSEVEINDLKNILDLKRAYGQKNMYFCCWLEKKWTSRCADDDIKSKKYFVVDIDIRLTHYTKTGIVLDDEQLNNIAKKIIFSLLISGMWDYCAIVYSWNWIHIYYSWEERPFNKNTYANWVKYIYEQIDEIIRDMWYESDKACCNLARVMRIPWTINPRLKTKKNKDTKETEVLRDMWDTECKLIFFEKRDSPIFDKIEEYAEEYNKQKEECKKEQVKVKEIVKKDYRKPDDIWKQINEIPAWDIACEIRGVTMLDRWLDNVTLREDTKNMGAYRYKPHNVIVNTWSSMIKTDKSYFTVYELVYYEMMNQDKNATLQYFRDRHWIKLFEKKQEWKTEIPKLVYEKLGYLYWNKTFDAFDCMMSGELCTIVARSNSWKTTFAMDIIQTNADRWKKCYYINLEFPIETMRQSRRLFINKKKKRNLTDIEPLTTIEKQSMDNYIAKKLRQFEYHNNPNWMKIEDVVDIVIDKQKQWYWLFVIDTFSRITWNLDSSIAHTNQNKTMETLQELCQNLWIVVILLHHTNKKWEFEWSQKIMDLSNVFITMSADEDMNWDRITKFALSKDKFVSSIEIDTYYENQEYSLAL